MCKKLTIDEVIRKARLVHGDRYDYNLFDDYTDNNTKIPIRCLVEDHGIFKQTVGNHNRGQGCPKCAVIKSGELYRHTIPELILKFKEVHGDRYDYNEILEYKNLKDKVPIRCLVEGHGIFLQSASHHAQGSGCPKCKTDISRVRFVSNKEQFVIDCNKVHGNRYDYDKLIYNNSDTKVEIICRIHGVFTQTPGNHKTGHGCPKCNSSIGEQRIENWLIENRINYKPEQRFYDCRDKNPLPFDFYLVDLNICIEYDGEQHFKSVERFGGDKKFEQLQHHDRIKDKYCKDEGIRLIRISYKQKEQIETILEEMLCHIKNI